jgi:putative transposase
MPQSLGKILVHVVFSTKDRRPFLAQKPLRDELHRYLGGHLAKLDSPALVVGGVEDHIHLLCNLSRTRAAADLVRDVKRASSIGPALANFAWQAGYGLFSVGASQIPAVRAYIAEQEEHHRQFSFQDELRKLLHRYGIDYDERYVWD